MNSTLSVNRSDDSGADSPVPFFAALCLFLSAVEYAIPKPLPFMRLGLANLPILISLAKLRKRDVLLLIVLKVLGQALISGTLFSYVFVFSAAGSVASGFTMLGLYMLFRHTGAVSDTGLSIAGALANNCAQVAVAHVMVFGSNTKYIAPVLFSTGLVTGLVLGVFANIFCAKSAWYRNLDAFDTEGGTSPVLQNSFYVPSFTVSCPEGSFSVIPRIQFCIAMILFPVFLLQKNIFIIWGCTAVFCVMTLIKKHGRVRLLPSLFMTLGVIFFALLSPFGRILFSIGSFHITQDAFITGLRKSGILTGMVFLSQFAVSPRLNLPGRMGRFLGCMFTVFDELTSKHISFKKGHIIEALDVRLLELWR
jgi:uncharacterized membrane protein